MIEIKKNLECLFALLKNLNNSSREVDGWLDDNVCNVDLEFLSALLQETANY